ncbi:MAG: glycosyltransferase [Nevskia sp.]|nr:glycosyltransferase [Nevskia sp.]
MNKTRLAIVSTHPIQYYAPVFRALAESAEVQPKVFYTWSQAAQGTQFDPGFGTSVSWDIPLLQGYEYEFVPNVSRKPGTERFMGIRNPGLANAIASWNPQALLVYGWNLHSHLQIMRRMKGHVPVYFRGDSTLLDHRPPLRRLARRAVLHWVYRHIDTAIAVGSNNADYFAWCGVPRQRIAVAPHSVDTRRFADYQQGYDERAAAWRRELGIGERDLAVVYAGKLSPTKDLALLVEAFKQLRVPAHLVLFGNGELEAELKARAQGRGNIHFMPFQNQAAMPAVYRVGDLFILPSRGETWGLGLNEAMACGRAIIASSKVGAARDLVREGVNGWTFESGSIGALVQTLETALGCGREVLHSMGAEAARIAGRWSTEASAAAIAAIVSSRHGGGADLASAAGQGIRPCAES